MHVSGIISAIIIGLVIGVLARAILPGRQNIGILLTIVVGIVAALIGTAIASWIGVNNTAGIDWIEIIIQVVVAIGGVALVSGLLGRRSTV